MTTTQTATQSPRGESISMLSSDASPLQVTGEGVGDNAGGGEQEKSEQGCGYVTREQLDPRKLCRLIAVFAARTA